MAFESLLKQIIGIKTPTGRSNYGQATLGSAVNYSARIEPVNRMFYDQNARERVAKFVIFLMPSVIVAPGCFIVYGSEDWEVISVEDVPGRDGSIHHKEVLV